MSFQWASDTAAACVFVNIYPRSLFNSPYISYFYGCFLTWTFVNGSWISCPRDFLKHRSFTWSYFRKWVLFWGVALAYQLLLDCMMVALQWTSWPVPSTLQPGIMNLWSLKFVILTALQALSVALCDSVLSTSAEGKRRGCIFPFLLKAFKDLCANWLYS